MHSNHHHNHHWGHNHGGNNGNGWNENYHDDGEPLWLFIVLRIIYTLWLTAYIIPNVFLIVTFMKQHFYKHNFFYTMVHWSLANLLHMVFAIYMLYVPENYRDDKLTLTFLAVHCIISGISLTMATYFVFDKFIKSKNFCVKSIRNNWVFTILHIAVVLCLVCTNLLTEVTIASGYIAFSSLIVLIFIARMLHFWRKGSEEENFKLRAWISGIFIFSTYVFTSWVIVEVLLGRNGRSLLVASLIILLANGLINTTLLYKHQKAFNARVTETENSRTRTTKEDTATIVVEPDAKLGDLPPKYDEAYELPPNYEEAAKVDGARKNFYENAEAPIQESAPVYQDPVYEEIDQYGRYPRGNRVNEDKDASTA